MSEFADLGIAIVGPGAIGDVHATSLSALGITVRAIVGPVAEEVTEFAAKHSVRKTYARLDQLLVDDEVQAVIVATPSHLHAEQTVALLSAGKHVLSEIPLGLNAADAHALVERAREVDRIVMGGYTLRYWEPHRRLQHVLADKDITPSQVVVRSLMLRQTNEGWTGRIRDWTDSVLWHQGGHAMDAALWHLRAEEPVTVTGVVGEPWPGSDTAMEVAALVSTADRRFASVSLSYHSRIAVSDFLVVSPEHTLLVTDGRLLLDGEVVYEAGGVAAAQSAAMIAQDQEFARAVVHGGIPETAADRILPAMDALEQLAGLA
jgi:2-hydroxy-4-carboxymuconate semialdehyde hemiacetal dehydrogenase